MYASSHASGSQRPVNCPDKSGILPECSLVLERYSKAQTVELCFSSRGDYLLVATTDSSLVYSVKDRSCVEKELWHWTRTRKRIFGGGSRCHSVLAMTSNLLCYPFILWRRSVPHLFQPGSIMTKLTSGTNLRKTFQLSVSTEDSSIPITISLWWIFSIDRAM